MAKNLYEVLGVAPSASADEIKQKSEQLIAAEQKKEGGGNTARIYTIIQAAAVLSNPEARQAYDQTMLSKMIPTPAGKRRRAMRWLMGGAVFVLIAAVGGGAWYAWIYGHIGNNPRAIRLDLMEVAVKRGVIAEIANKALICVTPTLDRPAAEQRGLPDLQPANAPGLYTMALALELPSTQSSRDLQLKQMDFLAAQGYFQVKPVQLPGAAGPKPAKEYRLTWEGWAATTGSNSSAPCFVVGRIAYDKVDSFEKTEEAINGHAVYELRFHTKFVPAVKWATTADAKAVFPDIDKRTQASDRKYRLVRGPDGWVSALEGRVLAEIDRASFKRLMQRPAAEPPEVSSATAKKLFDDYTNSQEGRQRAEQACLQLNLTGAGDDQKAPRESVRGVFTWQDKSDRQESQRTDMATKISVLEALAALGGATRETGHGKMPLAGEPAVVAPPPPPPPTAKPARGARVVPPPPVPEGPAWVRYRIDPAIGEILTLMKYGPGCIPLGAPKLEYLGAVHYGTSGAISVKAKFEAPPEIARKLAEHLPSVKLALTEGLAFRISIAWKEPRDSSEDGGATAGTWATSYGTYVLPVLRFTDLPGVVQPMMPLSAALFARDSPRATGAATPAAGAAVLAPAPAPAPTPFVAPAPAPGAVPARPRTGALDLPPANAALHVISVQTAESGISPTPQGRTEGVIRVEVKGASKTPVWLVVDAYEPVHWVVSIAPGSRVDRIMASGFYPQRVSITGRTNTEVDVGGEGPRYQEADPAQAAAQWVRTQYRTAPKSVQAGAKGSVFVVTPDRT